MFWVMLRTASCYVGRTSMVSEAASQNTRRSTSYRPAYLQRPFHNWRRLELGITFWTQRRERTWNQTLEAEFQNYRYEVTHESSANIFYSWSEHAVRSWFDGCTRWCASCGQSRSTTSLSPSLLSAHLLPTWPRLSFISPVLSHEKSSYSRLGDHG